MKTVLLILLDLAVVYFFFGHAIVRRIGTRRWRRRNDVRDFRAQLRHWLVRDWDLLSAAKVSAIREKMHEAKEVRREGSPERMEQFLQEGTEKAERWRPTRGSSSTVREYLEIVVVALALAFSIRALFFQPFKIPTGSMQPTLYGIHFIASERAENTNPAERVFNYLHFGRRTVNEVITSSGYLDPRSVSTFSRLPGFAKTRIEIGGRYYNLPGKATDVKKYLLGMRRDLESVRRGNGLYYEKGQILARGFLQAGDHLFVNRAAYSFTEPGRGDIVVFRTRGIKVASGEPLAEDGKFYIKRLVGLPGDAIKIADGKAYVKPDGADEFDVLDNPGFKHLYSDKRGYEGYVHDARSQYLRNSEDVFTVPEDSYLVLGDNSDNSKDGRFWGTVPRRNLVGKACFVWWPFSRRWGVVGQGEPAPEGVVSIE